MARRNQLNDQQHDGGSSFMTVRSPNTWCGDHSWVPYWPQESETGLWRLQLWPEFKNYWFHLRSRWDVMDRNHSLLQPPKPACPWSWPRNEWRSDSDIDRMEGCQRLHLHCLFIIQIHQDHNDLGLRWREVGGGSSGAKVVCGSSLTLELAPGT